MKLFIKAPIMLSILLLFILATISFASSTSFCTIHCNDSEKKLHAGVLPETQMTETLPEASIEEEKRKSLWWDTVLPVAGITLGILWAIKEGVVYGGQVGAWVGRTMGGTTASEVRGILAGKAIGGSGVAAGIVIKGPKFAVAVLCLTASIKKIRASRPILPNQDVLQEGIDRREELADVLEELADGLEELADGLEELADGLEERAKEEQSIITRRLFIEVVEIVLLELEDAREIETVNRGRVCGRAGQGRRDCHVRTLER